MTDNDLRMVPFVRRPIVAPFTPLCARVRAEGGAVEQERRPLTGAGLSPHMCYRGRVAPLMALLLSPPAGATPRGVVCRGRSGRGGGNRANQRLAAVELSNRCSWTCGSDRGMKFVFLAPTDSRAVTIFGPGNSLLRRTLLFVYEPSAAAPLSTTARTVASGLPDGATPITTMTKFSCWANAAVSLLL